MAIEKDLTYTYGGSQEAPPDEGRPTEARPVSEEEIIKSAIKDASWQAYKTYPSPRS